MDPKYYKFGLVFLFDLACFLEKKSKSQIFRFNLKANAPFKFQIKISNPKDQKNNF